MPTLARVRIALVHAWAGGPAAGGGGCRVMLDLGLTLDALGHNVTIVCHDFMPGTEHRNASRKLEFRAVRMGPSTAVRGKREALRRFWREMPRVAGLVPAVDIIDAHEWPALHAGYLSSRRLGVPFVWHRNDHTIFERAVVEGARHGRKFGRLARTARALGSYADFFDARRAAAIVAIDEQSRLMAERAYRRSVQAIPAPPADHFFDPPPRAAARGRVGIARDRFLVLGVGIMNPHRRFEDLVDALVEVGDQRVVALIIGSDHVDPGYGRFIRNRIRLRGLSDRINLRLRSVDENELRDAYAAADVFVFPNDYRQSWGLAPLESLASGTPVIVTRGAGVSGVLSGRPGVTVVEPHAPAQIARALRAHIEGHIRSDVAGVRNWLRDELGSRRYAERNLEVYSKALQGRAVR